MYAEVKPGKPATDPLLFSFDLDGTLWQVGHRLDWENPYTMDAHCRPHVDVCRLVRQIHEDGHRILFTTGRLQDTHTGVSLRQVQRHVSNEVMTAADWELRRPSVGSDIMAVVVHKADAFKEHRPDVHIGDADEDRTACAMTSTRFLPVSVFRTTEDLSRLYNLLYQSREVVA